jgi:hypothetical protein
MKISKETTKSGLSSIHNKSIGGLAAAITIALATLTIPMGLTGASAQAPPTTTITIDSAKLNPDRTVTVTYTVSCSEGATIEGAFVEVRQTVGRFGDKGVSGSSFKDISLPCDETGIQITQTVVAQSGFFTPGRATVFAEVAVCNEFDCFFPSTQQVVNLKR